MMRIFSQAGQVADKLGLGFVRKSLGISRAAGGEIKPAPASDGVLIKLDGEPNEYIIEAAGFCEWEHLLIRVNGAEPTHLLMVEDLTLSRAAAIVHCELYLRSQ